MNRRSKEDLEIIILMMKNFSIFVTQQNGPSPLSRTHVY